LAAKTQQEAAMSELLIDFKSHYWQLKLLAPASPARIQIDFKSHYWQLKPGNSMYMQILNITLNPTIGS